MNLNPKFEINFEEFGDFTSKLNLEGDVGNAYKIREHLETRAPLQLISQEKLDHGCGVPLYLLTKNIPKLKIIPLYYSNLTLEAHFNFGKLMQREIQVNKDRIAVVASGDLSHRLSKNAPAGYSPKGSKFDNKLIELLQNKKTQSILGMNEKLINEAGECGLRSIIILLGIMNGIEYKPEKLSYEGPFGVGYLSMNFKL
jgi:AmmeMemoRadiSam system protein B